MVQRKELINVTADFSRNPRLSGSPKLDLETFVRVWGLKAVSTYTVCPAVHTPFLQLRIGSKVPVRVSHKARYLRHEDGVVVFRAIIAVYYETDTKHTNTNGKILSCLLLKQVSDVITALRKRLTELVMRV